MIYSKHGIWIITICALFMLGTLYCNKTIRYEYGNKSGINSHHPCKQYIAEYQEEDQDNKDSAEVTDITHKHHESEYMQEMSTDAFTNEFTTKEVQTGTTSYVTNGVFDTVKNESYDSKIAERFTRRYKHMYKDCPTNEPEPGFFKSSTDILVNVNHGLEACVTGKSGSSSWHHLIWQLRQKDRGLSTDLSNYRLKHTYFNYKTSKLAENNELLHNWTHGIDDDFFTEPNPQKMHRVFVGRHPFARLISGWNQKTRRRTDGNEMHFLNSNPEMKNFKSVDPDEGHLISWEDWATYVSVHRKRKYRRDYHFSVAVEACKPCLNFFTYIVKLESLTEDYNWLMQRLGLTGNIKLGHAGAPNGKSEVNEDPGHNIQRYMKRLPAQVVQDLYDLYKPDFEHFGYTFDFDTYMAGGFD